jgi:hypothetical protein
MSLPLNPTWTLRFHWMCRVGTNEHSRPSTVPLAQPSNDDCSDLPMMGWIGPRSPFGPTGGQLRVKSFALSRSTLPMTSARLPWWMRGKPFPYVINKWLDVPSFPHCVDLLNPFPDAAFEDGISLRARHCRALRCAGCSNKKGGTKMIKPSWKKGFVGWIYGGKRRTKGSHTRRKTPLSDAWCIIVGHAHPLEPRFRGYSLDLVGAPILADVKVGLREHHIRELSQMKWNKNNSDQQRERPTRPLAPFPRQISVQSMAWWHGTLGIVENLRKHAAVRMGRRKEV